MKNLLFIALLFASTAAFAADSSVATPPATPPGKSAGDNSERPKMSFEEKKAKVLERLNKREACVNAATTPEALKACMPHRGKHRGEGRGEGFGGGRLNDNGKSEDAPGQQ